MHPSPGRAPVHISAPLYIIAPLSSSSFPITSLMQGQSASTCPLFLEPACFLGQHFPYSFPCNFRLPTSPPPKTSTWFIFEFPLLLFLNHFFCLLLTWHSSWVIPKCLDHSLFFPVSLIPICVVLLPPNSFFSSYSCFLNSFLPSKFSAFYAHVNKSSCKLLPRFLLLP